MQDWKQKSSNIQHYNLQAVIYDKQYVEEQDKKIETLLKNLDFDSKESVLDLGCGTGFLFKHISKKAGFMVGVDSSKKTLLCAKKGAKKNNAELVCADADNLPFVDNLFDKVFLVTVLQNMPDPKKTILEMKRSSKFNAVFAVTGLKKKFTKYSFLELLKSAHLKALMLNDYETLKDYTAVCVNL